MKKTIFTLLFGILGFNTLVTAQNSALTLDTRGNYLYSVQVDQYSSSYPDHYFQFNGLMPGRHHLMIYRYHTNHHNAKLVYNNYIDIPYNAIVNATLISPWFLKVTSVETIAPSPACEHHEYEPAYSTIGHDHPAYGGACGTPNGAPAYGPCAMNEQEFCAIKNTLASINFDSSRLQVAEQIADTHYMSSVQVAELLRLFTFDSSRLEFAKYAYKNTVDRNNYFLTYNVFTFDSSVNSLCEYIRHYS